MVMIKKLQEELKKLYDGKYFAPICFGDSFLKKGKQYFINRGNLASIYEFEHAHITGKKFTPAINISECISDINIFRMAQDILSGNFYLGEPVEKNSLPVTKWKEVDLLAVLREKDIQMKTIDKYLLCLDPSAVEIWHYEWHTAVCGLRNGTGCGTAEMSYIVIPNPDPEGEFYRPFYGEKLIGKWGRGFGNVSSQSVPKIETDFELTEETEQWVNQHLEEFTHVQKSSAHTEAEYAEAEAERQRREYEY